MKREKLYPPFLWRYLVQQAFQRRHPSAPVIVANAAILLDSWLRPTDEGLEWGSGRSTVWLAMRVARLTTIEHDPDWHDRVQRWLEARGLSAKVDYRLIAAPADQLDEPRDHPYATVADQVADGSLDFALIDGQMRLRCAARILSKLKPGGLMILDGANRYLPNRFEGKHTTIRHTRDQPLSDDWRALLERLEGWRAMNTSDGLWDTRFWIKPIG